MNLHQLTDHEHLEPEFVCTLEGSGRQAGAWMHKGWASVARTFGPVDQNR